MDCSRAIPHNSQLSHRGRARRVKAIYSLSFDFGVRSLRTYNPFSFNDGGRISSAKNSFEQRLVQLRDFFKIHRQEIAREGIDVMLTHITTNESQRQYQHYLLYNKKKLFIMRVTAPIARSAAFQQLLSNRAFDIEFNGYLSNHAKHAIIALERLNAPESRVQGYWDFYTRLTPYNLSLHRVTEPYDQVPPCTLEEWTSLRGKKLQFWNMCKFLDIELNERFHGSVEQLVKTYAPDTLSGLAGALTHGIIHLGWALDAYDGKHPWMVIEGLAYINFSYLSLHPETFEHSAIQETCPAESLRRMAIVWQQDNLADTWIAAAKKNYDENSGFHEELIPAGFQWELSKVLDQPHEIMTKLPTWLDAMSIDELTEELYKTSVLAYLVTRDESDGHGNFLVLHLITSLWGLEQVLSVIDDEKISRDALKCYYAAMVGLLSTSASGIPSVEAIDDVLATFGSSFDSNDRIQDLEEIEWSAIVARAIPEEEEHNIKLVYVTRELWRRYNHWTGFREAASAFTLTPNIGPSSASFKA
jgi:hypothetical protein